MQTPKRQTSILSFLSDKPATSPSTPQERNKENEGTAVAGIQQAAPAIPAPDSPDDVRDKSMETRYSWMVDIRDKNGKRPSDHGYDSSTVFVPSDQWKRFTPFEKQYWEIKSEHFDSIVLFKKGKFFELYENDADLAASLFDLKVTERVNMKMAGVPEASFNQWASRFIAAGYSDLCIG